MINETGWWLPSSDQISRREFSREFLSRELGIRLFSGEAEVAHQLNRVRNGQKALVFVDSSVMDLSVLNCFPKRSIILFILSDETYNLKLNLRALINNRVFAIVRDYPLGKFNSARNIPRILFRKLIRIVKHPSLFRLYFPALVSGIYMSLVQIIIRSVSALNRKPVSNMPLGYDSGFCEQFVRFYKLGISESLLEFSVSPENHSHFSKKTTSFYFSGQRGTFDRQLMLTEARQIGIEIESVHDSYQMGRSVENQNRHFEGLRKAKFSLCPPGNFSHRTFRYCESLLLFSYPILERFTLSDPLFENKSVCNWDQVYLKANKEVLDCVDESLLHGMIVSEIRKQIGSCCSVRELIEG